MREEVENKSWHAKGIALVLGFSFVICAALYMAFSGEAEPWLVVILLSVPLLHLPFTIHKYPEIVFYPAFGLFLFLWALYTFNGSFAGWVLQLASVFSLVASSAVVFLAFFVTWLALSPDGKGNREWVSVAKRQIRSNPFLSICFFITLFALVTYFLSFTAGFHDKSHRRVEKISALVVTQSLEEQRHEQDLHNFSASASKNWKILFGSGSSRIESKDEYLGLDRETLREIHIGQPSAYEVIDRGMRNAQALREIIEEIKRFRDYRRIRVLLVGHADDQPIKKENSSYPSNYELSEARINQVMLELIGRLEAEIFDENLPPTEVDVAGDGLSASQGGR